MRFITLLSVVVTCASAHNAFAQPAPQTNDSSAPGNVIPADPPERNTSAVRSQIDYVPLNKKVGYHDLTAATANTTLQATLGTFVGSYAFSDSLEMLLAWRGRSSDVGGILDPGLFDVAGGADGRGLGGELSAGLRYVYPIADTGLAFGAEAGVFFPTPTTAGTRAFTFGEVQGYFGRGLASWRGGSEAVPLDLDLNLGYFANPSPLMFNKECDRVDGGHPLCAEPVYDHLQARYTLGVGGPLDIKRSDKLVGQLLFGLALGSQMGDLHPRVELSLTPYFGQSGYPNLRITPGVAYDFLGGRTTVMAGIHYVPQAGEEQFEKVHPTGNPITFWAGVQTAVLPFEQRRTLNRAKGYAFFGSGDDNNGIGNGNGNGNGNNGNGNGIIPDESNPEGIRLRVRNILNNTFPEETPFEMVIENPGSPPTRHRGMLGPGGIHQFAKDAIQVNKDSKITVRVPDPNEPTPADTVGYYTARGVLESENMITVDTQPTAVNGRALVVPRSYVPTLAESKDQLLASASVGTKRRKLQLKNARMESNNLVFELRGLTTGLWTIVLEHPDFVQSGTVTVSVDQDSAQPAQLSNLKLTKRDPLKYSGFSINSRNGLVVFNDGNLTFEPDLPTPTDKTNRQIRRIGALCRDNRGRIDNMHIRVYWAPEEGSDANLARIIGEARAKAVLDAVKEAGCSDRNVESEVKQLAPSRIPAPVVVTITFGQ